MTSNIPRQTRQEGISSGFVTTVVVLAILFASVTTWDLWKARQEAARQAVVSSQNVALTIGHEIARTIDLYDHAIQAASTAFRLPGLDSVSPEIRHRTVFAAPTYIDYFGVMLVTDSSGRVLMESGALTPRAPDVSDRWYFTEHRKYAGLGLLISPPFASRTNGEPTIGLSRRYSAPDGSFGGVVMGAIEVRYFEDLTKSITLGDGASVTILTDDGFVLGQTRWDAGLAVAVVAGAPLDAPTGMRASARAGNLPIQVFVAVPFATVYASWQRTAMIIGAANFVLIVAMMVVALRAGRELRRRTAAEQSAATFAEDFRMLADSTTDIIMRVDLDGTISYVSSAVRETLGIEPAELHKRHWQLYVQPDDWTHLAEALQQMRKGVEQISVTYRATRSDGGVVWLDARMRLVSRSESGVPPEIIATLRDVTWQQAYEEQLSLLAATDGLTGVANRRKFDEWLDNEWRRAKRSGLVLSLIIFDVDFFKLYNDFYGHVGGDAVLRQIGECLSSEIGRPGDLAARYGGEEFAVLLPATDSEGAALVAENIRHAILARAIAHARSAHGIVTISVGVASLTATPETEPALLVTQADLALYAAKRGGRNQVVSYHGGINEAAA